MNTHTLIQKLYKGPSINYVITKSTIFDGRYNTFLAPQMLEKPTPKVAQKSSNPLFLPCTLSCPNCKKNQKNLCSKLWLIDQLYVELGSKFYRFRFHIPDGIGHKENTM